MSRTWASHGKVPGVPGWGTSRPLGGPALPLLLALAGCPKSAPEPSAEARPLAPGARLRELAWAPHDELVGLSGLALRAPGELWMAPERSGRLLAVPWAGTSTTEAAPLGPPRAFALEGLPEGVDVEALDFIDGELAILGTEGRGARTEDPIFVARLAGRRVEVEGALVFDYRPFGMEAEDNRGIEGLCVTSDAVVAASEAVIEEDGARYALLGLFPLAASRTAASGFVPHRVRLGSSRGKLSALACRAGESGVRVHAIERHYGVMRLVRFELGRTRATVEAKLVVDLAPHLAPEPPNLEGLTWVGPRTLLAISDNHHGRLTGPSRAILVDLEVEEPR